ncbi:MAG: 2-dehydro-3-deoxygalactonokinase [Candidatus Puniceispirillaceae bacterium]
MLEDVPFCIAVDWGTSSFRSWVFSRSGQVLGHFSGPYGIRQTGDRPFAEILVEARQALGPEAAGLPVIMCGMIGSAQGWQDAGYLQKTAGIQELAAAAIAVEGETDIWIISGVQSASADGLADVMRGEETALAGIIATRNITDGLFCLPGTHSKWVTIEAAQITSLSTFMTGEIFDLMSRHSILCPLIDPATDNAEPDPQGFTQGLKLAAGELGMLHHLFAVRAGILTGKFAAGSASSILSGLSIGSEIKHIAEIARAQKRPVYLNAAGVMANLYQSALTHFDVPHQLIDAEEASCAGLYEIARHLLADPVA